MELRWVEPEEVEAFITTVTHAFHETKVDANDVARDKIRFEAERSIAAVENGKLVSVGGAISWRTTTPGGGSVTTCGITGVGTLPTHRRQGLLTRIMDELMKQGIERGDHLATLFASQAAIYGRFGFGRATVGLSLNVDATRGVFHPWVRTGGTVRLLGHDEALPVMAELYRQVTPTRPGMVELPAERDIEWLFFENYHDEPKPFYAIHHDGDGAPDAYAVYSGKEAWKYGLPGGKLKVRHMIASSTMAAASLWRYLLDADLISRVTTWDRAIDEPLQWFLQEPRAIRAKLYDGLLARPLDVAGTLAARSYSADGTVVISVHDDVVPGVEGRYRLSVEQGEISCSRTDEAADLEGPANAIGAVALGGASWGELVRGGLATASSGGAVARADRMFATDPPPWAPFEY
jgi:predicted acetyltransferase